ARLAQKDVVGLEIAVDELARVGFVEPDGDLAQHAHDALRWHHALALERGAQLLSVEKLHHQAEAPVVGRLKVDDLHDVLVRQQLAHLELTLEALDGHRIAHDVRVQHLDGAVAPLDHVEGFVHAPHAPVGHYPPDLVAPEQHLPDPGVLGVAGDRDLGGAHQLLAVRRTDPGIGRVQAPANRTGLHSVHSPRHRGVPRLKHTTISGAAVTVGGFRLCGVEARRLGVDDPVAHRALPEIF